MHRQYCNGTIATKLHGTSVDEIQKGGPSYTLVVILSFYFISPTTYFFSVAHY